MTTYFPPTVATTSVAVDAPKTSNLVTLPAVSGTNVQSPPVANYLQPVVTQAGPAYPAVNYSNVGPTPTTRSRETGLQTVAPPTGNERPYVAPPVSVSAGEVFVKTL